MAEMMRCVATIVRHISVLRDVYLYVKDLQMKNDGEAVKVGGRVKRWVVSSSRIPSNH